jgi:hypothetical protein
MLTKNTYTADRCASFALKHEALCSKAGAEMCNKHTVCPTLSNPVVGTRRGFKYKISSFTKQSSLSCFLLPNTTDKHTHKTTVFC